MVPGEHELGAPDADQNHGGKSPPQLGMTSRYAIDNCDGDSSNLRSLGLRLEFPTHKKFE